jgi:hypothetical protein
MRPTRSSTGNIRCCENFLQYTQTLDGPPSCPRLPLTIFSACPAGAPPAGLFFTYTRERPAPHRVLECERGKKKMKPSPLLAAGFFLAMATFVEPAAAANEKITAAGSTPTVKAEVAVDCSKETWPNISPPCLRNTSSTVEVRLVTAPRR